VIAALACAFLPQQNKTTDLYQRVVKYLAVQLQARQILALSKDKPKVGSSMTVR
jgi:hypothetical protein